MLTDIYAHRLWEDPKLLEEVDEDDEFDADEVANLIQQKPEDWEKLE